MGGSHASQRYRRAAQSTLIDCGQRLDRCSKMRAFLWGNTDIEDTDFCLRCLCQSGGRTALFWLEF